MVAVYRFRLSNARVVGDSRRQAVVNPGEAVPGFPAPSIAPDAYFAISNPMLFAVPSTMLQAASRLLVLRSGNFIFAISSICAQVTLPTFLRLGSPEPFSRFRAFLRRSGTGEVLVTKLKLRSAYTVITTGMM